MKFWSVAELFHVTVQRKPDCRDIEKGVLYERYDNVNQRLRWRQSLQV